MLYLIIKKKNYVLGLLIILFWLFLVFFNLVFERKSYQLIFTNYVVMLILKVQQFFGRIIDYNMHVLWCIEIV